MKVYTRLKDQQFFCFIDGVKTLKKFRGRICKVHFRNVWIGTSHAKSYIDYVVQNKSIAKPILLLKYFDHIFMKLENSPKTNYFDIMNVFILFSTHYFFSFGKWCSSFDYVSEWLISQYLVFWNKERALSQKVCASDPALCFFFSFFF